MPGGGADGAYDMRDVVNRVVDDGVFLELQPAVGAQPGGRVSPG